MGTSLESLGIAEVEILYSLLSRHAVQRAGGEMLSKNSFDPHRSSDFQWSQMSHSLCQL